MPLGPNTIVTSGLRFPRRSTLISPAISSARRPRRFASGSYAPVPHHQVGNNEGIGLPEALEMPECQPNQ